MIKHLFDLQKLNPFCDDAIERHIVLATPYLLTAAVIALRMDNISLDPKIQKQ